MELARAPPIVTVRLSVSAASNLRRGRKVRRASSHGVCMSNVNEYDQFCRELASLAAKRLLGRTVDRATVALAFHEALLEIRRADTPMTESHEGRPKQDEPDAAPVEMPSEIANILGWHADHADMTIIRCEKEAHRIATEQQLFGAS
jgi:hypothetical protein